MAKQTKSKSKKTESRKTSIKKDQEKKPENKSIPFDETEEFIEPEESEEEIIVEKIVSEDVQQWQPKTELGRLVKEGRIKNIDEILSQGKTILEEEIVDALLPNLSSELILVGQAKGKFGGGQRRVFRQTQKKTEEGNKPHFTTVAVVGDYDGHVGIGIGKAKETVPSREKAIRKAKLNIIKIKRGCGSWQCHCGEHHSVPFRVVGKCASVELELIPAPKGNGLVINKELAKVLRLAGVKDVWGKSRGKTKNKINHVAALWDCLLKMSEMRITNEQSKSLGIVDGTFSIANELANDEILAGELNEEAN